MTEVQERAGGPPHGEQMRDLIALVRERIGMKPDLSALKIEAILRAMAEPHRSAYCRRLAASNPHGAAWQSFAETLLVHETYFFRHPEQLRMLATELLPQLLRTRSSAGSRELRIWCPGCSSGEEVYTLALLVQGALGAHAVSRHDLGAWSVIILGTDVSLPTLELARLGRYTLSPGLNSFRDVPQFARHHFSSIFVGGETVWTADAGLRRMTRFAEHNLVTDPPPLRDLDLVVCRNALIYFDEDALQTALTCIEGALRPGGALVLGPAETTTEQSRLEMNCSEQTVFWLKSVMG